MQNWPDILRVAATPSSRALPPSQLPRKFTAYPRQHELAVTLRKIGRFGRTLFIVDWLLDADMQRRANTDPNKDETHHPLKNTLRIKRQGEIRNRSSEGRHYRMTVLNLLADIVIYWNTAHLNGAVRQRKHAGLTVEPESWPTSHPLGGPISCLAYCVQNSGDFAGSTISKVRKTSCAAYKVASPYVIPVHSPFETDQNHPMSASISARHRFRVHLDGAS